MLIFYLVYGFLEPRVVIFTFIYMSYQLTCQPFPVSILLCFSSTIFQDLIQEWISACTQGSAPRPDASKTRAQGSLLLHVPVHQLRVNLPSQVFICCLSIPSAWSSTSQSVKHSTSQAALVITRSLSLKTAIIVQVVLNMLLSYLMLHPSPSFQIIAKGPLKFIVPY